MLPPHETLLLTLRLAGSVPARAGRELGRVQAYLLAHPQRLQLPERFHHWPYLPDEIGLKRG